MSTTAQCPTLLSPRSSATRTAPDPETRTSVVGHRIKAVAGTFGAEKALSRMMVEDRTMKRDDLERVLKWADEKLTTGNEPPWSWYRYMQLKEAVGAIIQGMDVTRPMEDSPQSSSRPGGCLRLVDSTDSPDSARSRCDRPREIPLPM